MCERRELFIGFSASDSIISGNGTNSVVAFEVNRITVTAYDSSGGLLGVGGELLAVEIYNECRSAAQFECNDLGGVSVLPSPIIGLMTDNNDGTYHYDYTVDLDGIITVQVLHLNMGVSYIGFGIRENGFN